ncbi:MAG: hypothetical protein V2I33_08970 [Kangiellaceae bacterium]|jgi:hypothetical protein|nr:hypothetical protein [Kangiellaceae bacterium]
MAIASHKIIQIPFLTKVLSTDAFAQHRFSRWFVKQFKPLAPVDDFHSEHDKADELIGVPVSIRVDHAGAVITQAIEIDAAIELSLTESLVDSGYVHPALGVSFSRGETWLAVKTNSALPSDWPSLFDIIGKNLNCLLETSRAVIPWLSLFNEVQMVLSDYYLRSNNQAENNRLSGIWIEPKSSLFGTVLSPGPDLSAGAYAWLIGDSARLNEWLDTLYDYLAEQTLHSPNLLIESGGIQYGLSKFAKLKTMINRWR